MKKLQLRSGSLAYEECGQGAPLVLLHANPGDHRDFDAIIPVLSQTYRTIALDWPGYGESPAFDPPESASAMRFADVLEEVVAALDLHNAIFIGNSVGGYAATRLAITQPDRVGGLILVDTGGFTPPSLIANLFCRLKGMEWFTRTFETAFTKWYLKRRNALVNEIISRANAGRHNPAQVATNAAVWRSFAHSDHDLRERARRIIAPTLLVWGRYDPVIKLAIEGKIAASTIPNARLEVLETGHMAFAEDPDAFLGTIKPFLQEVTAHARIPSHA